MHRNENNKKMGSKSNGNSDREIIFDLVYQIIFEDKYSNLLLRKVESQHRAFINEIVYGIIERRITLDYIISKYSNINLNKIHKNVKVLLYMGIYQLLFMKTKDYAAIYETVELAKLKTHKGSVSFINGILRTIQREKSTILEAIDKENPSIKYSIPEELLLLLEDSYNATEIEKILTFYNSKSRVHLYVRRNLDKIEKELKANDISYLYKNNFLMIEKYEHQIFEDYFRNGDFAFIDISTSLILDILKENQVKDINCVLDTCAAPGGKTLMLHDLYPNARFVASDVSETRIKLVEKNIKKWDINGVTTRRFDARKIDKNSYDLVICDVPCTGSGVIGRRPELKYKIDRNQVFELTQLQKEIVDSAAVSVKKDGYMIYSTCSILKPEDEDMAKYIEEELGLTKIAVSKELVSEESEGFFVALFKKVD